jgi:hypothetical protein
MANSIEPEARNFQSKRVTAAPSAPSGKVLSTMQQKYL